MMTDAERKRLQGGALAHRIGWVLADLSRAAGMGHASRMIAEGHSLERMLAVVPVGFSSSERSSR